jgi:hypothetical protein
MVEAYLSVLDLAYFEVEVAFEGLADEHVWKRPAAGLLSVGELAGHIAYWEAVRLAGQGEEQPQPDRGPCRVNGPLIDRRFRYYDATITHPPSEQHRAMTAAQVCGELLRVHREAVAQFKALNPALESPVPGPHSMTYDEYLKYASFHVSYHTGQMYSVRHLLGESTPDN